MNREEYEAKMKQGMEDIVTDVSQFVADSVMLNAKIREMPINPSNADGAEFIKKSEIPAYGRDTDEIGRELIEYVFDNALLCQHPRFFSFVPGAVSPHSLVGAILADVYNFHGGGWSEAPGACAIEEKLIQWMGGLAGYDTEKCGGIFMSGGSMANMSAMIAARDTKLGEKDFPIGTVYLSDQAHSSVRKGIRMIGFRNDQQVLVPTDDNFRMRTDLLEKAIEEDIAAGKKPFAVVASMGTTNTGSIDDLYKIGMIAQKYNLWFHVDGAFGGSMLLTKNYKSFIKGIELFDSLSWDTHKWLMQVYSCSSLIVKDKQTLINSFAEHPEYLDDLYDQDHVDPWNLGPEMTRPHRAIKLWCTIQAMGTEMLSYVVDYSVNNAFIALDELLRHPNWDIISKPSCGTINFRYAPSSLTKEEIDDLNGQISKEINDTGYAYIVTTKLKGKRVLRICAINANTTADDVRSTIIKLDEIAQRLTNNI